MSQVAEPALRRVPMSYDDWLHLPDKPKAEWVDGEAVFMNAGTPRRMDCSYEMASALKASLPHQRVYQEVGVPLPRNRVRIPDVTVVSRRQRGTLVDEVPVLVAEILSPSTRSEDLLRKSVEYADAGIEQYWVLDPDVPSLEVFQLVEGRWEPLLRLDDRTSQAEVSVPGHGAVPLDLHVLVEA